MVLRGVGGGAGAAGAEPAADQVPGGLREADGLHGVRDGARRDAVVAVLRRRLGHAEVPARVPLLHHPAGAQRKERGAVAGTPIRSTPRAPRRLQARQRQRHALHQPASPDPELAGLRSLRQRLQGDSVDQHPGERQHRQRRLQASDGRHPGRRDLRGVLVHLLIPFKDFSSVSLFLICALAV